MRLQLALGLALLVTSVAGADPLLEWLSSNQTVTDKQAKDMQGVWVPSAWGGIAIQGWKVDQAVANWTEFSAEASAQLFAKLSMGAQPTVRYVVMHVDPRTGVFYGYRVDGDIADPKAADSIEVHRMLGTVTPLLNAPGLANGVLYAQWKCDRNLEEGGYIYGDLEEGGKTKWYTLGAQGTELWEQGASKPHWAQKAGASEFVRSDEPIDAILPVIQAALPLKYTVLAEGALSGAQE